MGLEGTRAARLTNALAPWQRVAGTAAGMHRMHVGMHRMDVGMHRMLVGGVVVRTLWVVAVRVVTAKQRTACGRGAFSVVVSGRWLIG